MSANPACARIAVSVLELIKGATLTLRFLLELCALGALGHWGFRTSTRRCGRARATRW